MSLLVDMRIDRIMIGIIQSFPQPVKHQSTIILPLSGTGAGGVAQAALHCAHRTICMLPPSVLVFSLGMGAD
jgi:hypothetical protein